MKNLVYEGDATSHGGTILTGSDRVKVKGRRAARIGDRVSCPIHGDNEIVEGSDRMMDGARALSRGGDHTQCGAVFIASSGEAQVR
ncbi:MAG TPA: PAAR domain-containing protein [Candidatus Sulfotelmatobacter sp.]|nr:PAAR domain-containing protein [Candidatus Sulfotelmatobacter sp.]